jgi:hypothetical protein
MMLPDPMRQNAPRFGTFGGGLRFNESQHFYSYVSDADKVPRRSTPFHHGLARGRRRGRKPGPFGPLDVRRTGRDPARGAGPDRAPLLDVLAARLDEHLGDSRCDDILLLLVTMR